MAWLEEIFLPEEAKQALRDAQHYINKQNYDAALTKLQLATAIRGNIAEFHALQAFCYYHKEMYSSAIHALRTSYMIDNEYPPYFYYMGLVQTALKKFDDAIENYRKAIQLGYQQAELYNDLGLTYFKKGDTEKAISQYNIAISKDPCLYQAHTNLAETQLLTGDYKNAIDSCKSALLINTRYTEAYQCLAQCYIKTNDYQSAIKNFKNILAYEPENFSALIELGKIYNLEKEYDEAIYYLNKSLEKQTDNIEILTNLATVYFESGFIENAVAFYNKLLKLSGELADIYFSLGQCFYTGSKIQDIEKAITYFQKDYSLDENHYLSLYYLGLCYTNSPPAPTHPYIPSLEKEGTLKVEGSFEKDTSPAFQAPPSKGDFSFTHNENNSVENSDIENKNFLNSNKEIAFSYFEKLFKFESEEWDYQLFEVLAKTFFEKGQYGKASEYLKKALRKANQSKQNSEIIESLNDFLEQIYELNDKNNSADNNKLNNKFINSGNTYKLVERLRNCLHKHPVFENLYNKTSEIIADFDKPLILTVMGEFKVGKSTFINALVGKEIAPMGVTPTTATINYFQYGSRSKIRINWSDGSEPDSVKIDKLAEYVDERKVNKQEVENIKLVEVFHDWELLRDINVVDTPGLNAGIKRHEETTMNFIEHADAIIWLFDVEQAGKASEKKIFEFIHSFSKKTVCVINGADKVEPEDLQEVSEYLKQQFGDYFSDIIHVSAKNALKAKLNNNQGLLEKSYFPELEKFLNNNIYSQSYQIKNQSILNKLSLIILEAKSTIEQNNNIYNNILAKIAQFNQQINDLDKQFNMFTDQQAQKLKEGFNDIYNQAGKEAKEFINPARGFLENVFGSNKFTPEDQNFLLKSIQENTSKLLNKLQKETEEKAIELNNIFSQYFNQLNENTFKELKENNYLSLLKIYHENKIKDIYSRVIFPNYRYYQGYLDAGTLDKFFTEAAQTTDLSLTNLTFLIRQNLPDIISAIRQSLQDWSVEYFKFISDLTTKLERDLNHTYSDTYESLFKTIEKIGKQIEVNSSPALLLK